LSHASALTTLDSRGCKAGLAYVELGKQALGEVVMSTPAISDGVIVIRTLRHLWGIGATPAKH